MPKVPARKKTELETAVANASEGGGLGTFPTQKSNTQAGRILYIECKAGSLTGSARIGQVKFSKPGRTLYYRGQTFHSLKGAGFKSNYDAVDTGDDYWSSGPKRKGAIWWLGTRT